MKTASRLITMISTIVALVVIANAKHTPHETQQQQKRKQDSADKNDNTKHDHFNEVNKRGDQAMGFSHAKTTHHFRLKLDGGIIEVTANDTQDALSRDQIRQHLKHISQKFSKGDFSMPMFIHAQTPPGIDVMKRLKADIKYQYEEIERGAQVRITTNNTEALKAIYDFLRFQIDDHQTGDAKVP